MNPGPSEPQSDALANCAIPTIYEIRQAQSQTCSKGFEPPTHGLEGRCSIQLSYEHRRQYQFCRIPSASPSAKRKRVMGIEPTCPAWKAGVLPLNYTRILYDCVGVTGFEPATSWSQTRRSSQAEPHPARDQTPFLTTHVPLYNTVFFLSTAFCDFFKFSPHHSQKNPIIQNLTYNALPPPGQSP